MTLAREQIRQMLELNILEEFVNQGLSMTEAETHLEKMRHSGEIGRHTDIVVAGLSPGAIMNVSSN